jgi:hypothetical protein
MAFDLPGFIFCDFFFFYCFSIDRESGASLGISQCSITETKMPEISNLKGGKIYSHGFRVFSSWLVGSIVLGL